MKTLIQLPNKRPTTLEGRSRKQEQTNVLVDIFVTFHLSIYSPATPYNISLGISSLSSFHCVISGK
jgi:hypothetical protein